MAGQIFLTVVNGLKVMARAVQTSSGASSAGNIVALGSNGLIDPTMMSATAIGTTLTATATAAMSAGMVGHYYYTGGLLNVKPADNTSMGSEANCFVNAGFANGATGTIILSGMDTALSGLTDAPYFLGAAGAVTQTPPTTPGYNNQYLGRPTSATSMEMNFVEPGMQVA